MLGAPHSHIPPSNRRVISVGAVYHKCEYELQSSTTNTKTAIWIETSEKWSRLKPLKSEKWKWNSNPEGNLLECLLSVSFSLVFLEIQRSTRGDMWNCQPTVGVCGRWYNTLRITRSELSRNSYTSPSLRSPFEKKTSSNSKFRRTHFFWSPALRIVQSSLYASEFNKKNVKLFEHQVKNNRVQMVLAPPMLISNYKRAEIRRNC